MSDEIISTLQQHRLAYPEAAWIASCGNEFPSRVSWVYKHFSKVDVLSESVITIEVVLEYNLDSYEK